MLINEKNGDQGLISAKNLVFVGRNSDVRMFDDRLSLRSGGRMKIRDWSV